MHPFQKHREHSVSRSRVKHILKADGGTVDDVRDILLEQRSRNESEEQQGMNPTRNLVKGPTHQNLRNKQWTDATDGRGKQGRYGPQFVSRKD